MEVFAASGFDLSALLAPELTGTAAGARQGLSPDSRAAEAGAAPFSLALAAAASPEPQAATPPATGKILPLFDGALAAARAHDLSSPPTAVAQGRDLAATLSLSPASTSTIAAAPSAPSPTAAIVIAASAPHAIGSEMAALSGASPVVSADPAVPQSPATASALDANGAKLASPVPDTAADSVRLVANELEGKTPELLRDAPAQRSSEQTTGRAISVREALQPPPTELARQRLSAMTAADSASVPATTPIAKEFHRLDGAPRVSEVGTTTPGVAAIVTEASAAQSVDAPKLAAELPAGNEARLPGALADRLQWMIDQNLGEARIKLNPPQLGAIDIKITMADDQAFVQFTASQPGARDVIESALPRLRDLLGAAGLELGGATVGGQTTSREQAEVRWSALPELEPLDVSEALTGVSQPARGRIDIYA